MTKDDASRAVVTRRFGLLVRKFVSKVILSTTYFRYPKGIGVSAKLRRSVPQYDV